MNTLKKITNAQEVNLFQLEETGQPVLSDSITSPISAGFPDPAADYHKDRIYLVKELITHPLFWHDN